MTGCASCCVQEDWVDGFGPGVPSGGRGTPLDPPQRDYEAQDRHNSDGDREEAPVPSGIRRGSRRTVSDQAGGGARASNIKYRGSSSSGARSLSPGGEKARVRRKSSLSKSPSSVTNSPKSPTSPKGKPKSSGFGSGPGSAGSSFDKSGDSGDGTEPWKCKVCSRENAGGRRDCGLCGAERGRQIKIKKLTSTVSGLPSPPLLSVLCSLFFLPFGALSSVSPFNSSPPSSTHMINKMQNENHCCVRVLCAMCVYVGVRVWVRAWRGMDDGMAWDG